MPSPRFFSERLSDAATRSFGPSDSFHGARPGSWPRGYVNLDWRRAAAAAAGPRRGRDGTVATAVARGAVRLGVSATVVGLGVPPPVAVTAWRHSLSLAVLRREPGGGDRLLLLLHSPPCSAVNSPKPTIPLRAKIDGPPDRQPDRPTGRPTD